MSLLLQNVRKSYPQPDGTRVDVLDVERFEMGDGEQVVLVGESGGGKTSLLNIIAGISLPDAGEVRVDGVEVTRLPEAARDRFRAQRIGYVFQTFNLLPAFSALENVLLGMSFSGRGASRARSKELLELVGLGHRLRNRPSQLSVGEQQRVAVARALANSPTLMLADEPTANVDAANQDKVLELIRDACRRQNVALLLVTHSEHVAGQFERVEKLSEFNRAA